MSSAILFLGAAALGASPGCGDDTTTEGPECGNGVREDAEFCDGSQFSGQTCISQGFTGGELKCTESCSFDTSDCTDDPPECGDGVAAGEETCDGSDLGGETCSSQGFEGGSLSCADDCGSYDTSACTAGELCGNGELDDGEDCDDTELGDATCQTEGFASGQLACSDNCTFDFGDCQACGNDEIDAGEDCDGDNLDGASCTDVPGGFDSGELGCTPGCAFDTSNCTFEDCGNGSIDGKEECDDMAFGASTCMTEGFVGGSLTCNSNCTLNTDACTTCGDNTINGADECDGPALGGETCLTQGSTGGALSCASDCTFNTAACTNLPLPPVGQLVITEIMKEPTNQTQPAGEWFEIQNINAATTYQLRGCSVQSMNAAETFTISTDLTIAPNSRLTFASSMGMPGFTPSYSYPNTFNLSDADVVRLVCNAVTVDEVVYDNGTLFPDPTGGSLSLDPGSTTAVGNNVGSSWCDASTTVNLTTGDEGTPGAANPVCAVSPVYTVGFCRLQFPATITAVTGTTTSVFGRVFVSGLTDMSGVNNPAPELLAAVGYGPDGSDPALPTWTWTAAIPNAGYGPASPSYEANNDEYQATLTTPAPGAYDYAYRFSGDSGATWTYCDTGAGSSDNYQAAQAGQLTSTTPPLANIWINELHYDNQATDADEGVEIAGLAGTDLAGYSIVTYNGSNGMTYGTPVALTGVIDNEGATGYGALWFPIAGLQNGDPDGLALIGPGGVVMYFLSYDGTFTAANGPASGMMSTNLGVTEPDAASNPAGLSLQLKGGGDAYAEFKWFAPSAHSRGSLNVDQYVGNYQGFYPTLQGCQEVPPNASTATGGGFAVVDLTAHNLIYRMTFAGLGSAESAAHIHGPAARGASAGVVFTLMSGSPKTGTVALTTQQEADVLAGLYYFNIHTANFPNGEVRAQIDNLMTCP